MRIEVHGRPQRVQLDIGAGQPQTLRGLGGQFFSEILRLPPGHYAARVQIMFSEAASGEKICLAVRSMADNAILDRLELAATAANRALLDDQYLRFHLASEQNVEIFGHSEAHCTTTLLRFMTIIDTPDGNFAPEDFYFHDIPKPSIADLACVVFGTTAVCNASCLHCPTNKDYRRDFPHGYMNFDLFEKIIGELAEGGYLGWFLFGLFGEPLEDPLLERRLRLIKHCLPKARISIATNCGVYDPQKHAFLVDLADDIGIHVEGISPEVYDRFMHPLKTERVFPKILSLLDSDKANKVHITTPVHKGNLAEVPNLRRYFETYGAGQIHFTIIGNRSWERGPWSELTLAPTGGWCHPSDLSDLIIDWDGAVLACCLDFSKSATLGELSKQSINEVLNSEAWSAMFEVHRTKSWAKKSACASCRYDHSDVVQGIVQTLLASDTQPRRVSPQLFRLRPGVTWDDSATRISVGETAPNGIVIYGPYHGVSRGRYRISHFIDVVKLLGSAGHIEIDVFCNPARQLAAKSYPVTEPGPLELEVEFEGDGSITEFRVAKTDVEFVHKGALLRPL